MGIINGKTGVLLLSIVLLNFTAASSTLAVENRILEQLEKGEILSSKAGASFFVQALVNKEPEKVQMALSDITKLPIVFPQIAFVRPYVGPDGKRFLYLKVRGLGDGLGLVFEVKSGGGEAFANAKELVLSGDYNATRDTVAEVDPSKEPNQLELKKEIDNTNQKGARGKFIGVGSSLILEGPLNEVMQLPNVRLTINLGISSYMDSPIFGQPAAVPAGVIRAGAPAAARRTYMIVKVGFGNQAVTGELGDYRGFGEHRLSIAEQLGKNVFTALKSNLEKL